MRWIGYTSSLRRGTFSEDGQNGVRPDDNFRTKRHLSYILLILILYVIHLGLV